MRIRLTFGSAKGMVSLPRHYNEHIQGFIYRHLDAQLARRLHEEGQLDPQGKRRLKLFTFSRLMGKWRLEGGRIVFSGPVRLVIASPMNDFLESLVTHLMRKQSLELNGGQLELISIEVEPPIEWRRPLLVQTLSPITVYSTVRTFEGRQKTYYYTPWEKEFEELLLLNLQRKIRTWQGFEVEVEGTIQPFRVSPRDEHVIKYKGTVIKGWTGVYRLDLPPDLLEMAYQAGLGAKNSQGFGCVEVWRAGRYRYSDTIRTWPEGGRA